MQWKSHTLTLLLCLKPLTAAAPGYDWVQCMCLWVCALALKHFRPKTQLGFLPFFSLTRSSSSSWSGLWEKRTAHVSPGLSLVVPMFLFFFIFFIFAVSRTAPFLKKLVSCCWRVHVIDTSAPGRLPAAPLVTVCWPGVTDTPQCVVLFACDQGEQWTPVSGWNWENSPCVMSDRNQFGEGKKKRRKLSVWLRYLAGKVHFSSCMWKLWTLFPYSMMHFNPSTSLKIDIEMTYIDVQMCIHSSRVLVSLK